nr:hypothetical protein [Tanacetum cinerariifolium]
MNQYLCNSNVEQVKASGCIDTDKTNSGGNTKILQTDKDQGKDVDNQVNLEENTVELDQGQSGSNPGKPHESRPPPEQEFMNEDQAGPDPRVSHVVIVGPNPEPTHEEFMANVYPDVHESLKFPADEHVILEEPLIPIHQASTSVPPLSTLIIDLSPPKPQKARILSLNEDIFKMTILSFNMPYPSRKIRRIRACTHQRPQRKQAQYAVSSEDQYVANTLQVNLDNSTSNVLIPLDSWTSGLLVYKETLSGKWTHQSSTTQTLIFTTTTTTTTTTLLPPPPPQQQSLTDSELAARVTSLERKFADLEQKNQNLDTTSHNLGYRVFTLELRDLPHKINQTVSALVKEAVRIALQASLRDRFRELPEANMKEILHQRMFESGSYKSLPKHVALYEALEASMEQANRDEFFAEKDKSRKRRHDDQDPPPPLPDSDPSKKRRHDSGASGSTQPPAPQSLAWKMSNTRETPSSSSRKKSTSHSEQPIKDVPIPDDVNISDFKDTDIAYLPKIKTKTYWMKPVPEEDRPTTPKPDWVIPSNELPEPENNWANILASSYHDCEVC